MPQKLDRAGACQSWGPYVRYVADEWGLRDWVVAVDNGHPESKEHTADVKACVKLRQATISFSDHFLDCDDEPLQRSIVAHEVLHAHFEACAQMAERHLGALYPDFLDMFEQGIEGASKAFAEKLLLPGRVVPAGTDTAMEIE